MIGDRGMITNTRIGDLKESPGLDWITALRAPAIATLASDDGPLQMSLFDVQNFAEITHPDFPGERLVCCRNPALAEKRTHKRLELLAAAEQQLDKVTDHHRHRPEQLQRMRAAPRDKLTADHHMNPRDQLGESPSAQSCHSLQPQQLFLLSSMRENTEKTARAIAFHP